MVYNKKWHQEYQKKNRVKRKQWEKEYREKNRERLIEKDIEKIKRKDWK
jgi:hypothetical protein